MSTAMTCSLEARPTADEVDVSVEVNGAEQPTWQRNARLERWILEDNTLIDPIRDPSDRLISEEDLEKLCQRIRKKCSEHDDMLRERCLQRRAKQESELLSIQPRSQVPDASGHSSLSSQTVISPIRDVSDRLISDEDLEKLRDRIRKKCREYDDMLRERCLQRRAKQDSESLSVQPSTQVLEASGYSSLSSRTVVSDHDVSSASIYATIQELLSIPITQTSEAFRGPDGMPLGIEVAVNAYARGEYSTGEIELDMLPEGLKILQPKTEKRATSDDVSLGWRATYYTAVTRMNDDEAEELFSEKAGGEALRTVAESDETATVGPSVATPADEAIHAWLTSGKGVQSIAGSIHGDSEPSSSPGSPSDELSATSPVLKRDLPILFPIVRMPTKPIPLRLTSASTSKIREPLSAPLPGESGATELSYAYSTVPLSAPLPYRPNTIGLLHPYSRASLDTTGPNSPFIQRNRTLERRSSPEALMSYAKAVEDLYSLKRIEADDDTDDKDIVSGVWQDDMREKRTDRNMKISEGYPMKNKTSVLRRLGTEGGQAEEQLRTKTTRRSSSLYSRELDHAVSTENEAIITDMMHHLDTGARRKGKGNFGKVIGES